MKVAYLTVFLIFLTINFGLGQDEKLSMGDKYYLERNYPKAIEFYKKQRLSRTRPTLTQRLRLAECYHEIGDHKIAAEEYLQLFEVDSLLDLHQFNKMLVSFKAIGEGERIEAFLATKQEPVMLAVRENASFNKELLVSSQDLNGLNFKISSIKANSPVDDFSPAFYDTSLLFTSARPSPQKLDKKGNANGYLDIFSGTMGPNGAINDAIPFKELSGSKYHKATPYYSKEIHSLFYVLSNTDDKGELQFSNEGKNALGIGRQKLEGGQFSFVWRNLETSFYYPFYDPKTSRLYFAAALEDSYGGTDLYYVNTNNGQMMSNPVNLGPRINTPGNEISPFIFDGSLYFSSDIFYSLGGMDVFKADMLGNSEFTIPINLGEPINTTADDFGFIIKNQGEGLLGYFSSNRDGGKGGDDIYSFVVDKKPGLRTFVAKGQILNHTYQTPIEQATIEIYSIDGLLLAETFSDEKGNYNIEIPWRKALKIKCFKQKHATFEILLQENEMEQISNPFNIFLALYDDLVEEQENQKVVKLRKFYFDKGKSQITPEIAKELSKVVDFVKFFPLVDLRIESHTDSRGGSTFNFKISQERSDAIKKFLIEKGVSPSNIIYSIGYGEDKLINDCKNGVFCLDLLHNKNNRSLIVVLNDNVLFD